MHQKYAAIFFEESTKFLKAYFCVVFSKCANTTYLSYVYKLFDRSRTSRIVVSLVLSFQFFSLLSHKIIYTIHVENIGKRRGITITLFETISNTIFYYIAVCHFKRIICTFLWSKLRQEINNCLKDVCRYLSI